MAKTHRYEVTVEWTGNKGTGTSGYRAYDRDYEITSGTKPPVAGSSDPAFRGDAARWCPEELLVAALAACHKLWYLHLCAVAGVIVTDYVDRAAGEAEMNPDGTGRFVRAVLKPEVTIAPDSDADKALALHKDAHAKCLIALSVNFPVEHAPEIRT